MESNFLGETSEFHQLQNKKELPYITISHLPLNLLIDTDSIKFFINPELAHTNFSMHIRQERLVVVSVFQNYYEDKCIKIFAFKEFRADKLKFNFFKYHKTFILTEFDNLTLLKAKLSKLPNDYRKF